MSDNMNKPVCVLQSPLFTRSGYGDWAMEVAKSLLRYNKYELIIVPTKWGGCPQKNLIEDFDQSDTELKSIVDRILKSPLNKQPELFIQITIPNEFQAMGKYNIGMTAGIESTLAPGDWIEGLNRMNMNIMTSVHSKKVFELANYTKQYQDGKQEQLISTKPMEVCFWGANTQLYKKTNELDSNLEEAFSKIPEDFAYLFVGQWTHSNGLYTDRKDIGNLIRTFCNAFKNHKGPKPCLILKTNGVNFSQEDKYSCLHKITAIRNEVGGDIPNVYLLHGELTDKQMNCLYNHPKVKVHVSFTHGEGYGHPLLLASLSGKPLAVSNWSGHLDFLNPKYTNLLEGTLNNIPEQSANQWLIKESRWFTVAYNLAEDKLRQMYFHYNDALKERAEKLRLENIEKFSLQAMDAEFHKLLDKYVPEFSVEQKIVLPSIKKISLPKKKAV